jgi:hypothetical protein
MRIVGCAGPLQKGHRSTRSTHAPQTAWPQSTNATDFDAAQRALGGLVAAARAVDDCAPDLVAQVLDARVQLGERIQ